MLHVCQQKFCSCRFRVFSWRLFLSVKRAATNQHKRARTKRVEKIAVIKIVAFADLASRSPHWAVSCDNGFTALGAISDLENFCQIAVIRNAIWSYAGNCFGESGEPPRRRKPPPPLLCKEGSLKKWRPRRRCRTLPNLQSESSPTSPEGCKGNLPEEVNSQGKAQMLTALKYRGQGRTLPVSPNLLSCRSLRHGDQVKSAHLVHQI